MDALLASAGPIRQRRRPTRTAQPGSSTSTSGAGPSTSRDAHKTVPRGKDKPQIDPTHHSILHTTRIPKSFQHGTLPTGSAEDTLKPDQSISGIKDKKLRQKVGRQDVVAKRAQKEREEVNEWLNAPIGGGAGGIEVDEEMGERTWRVGQDEIVREVGEGAGRKKFDLKLEGMGSYTMDYSRNGRHLAIASSKGHIATFDWQAGRLHSEIQLREAVRDIKFLQSEAYYAVAQKKYVFVYDINGVELHKMKQHMDVTNMEYLPYHYLLATVGHAGYLKYHDVSTGLLLTQIPSHLGSPSCMAQNTHSAIVHLGHSNGTMTLWSPNLHTPHIKLLAHKGPVTGIAVDPSERSAGRYIATCGMEGTVKLWDGRMWGKEIRHWNVRNSPTTLEYSQRGMLAIGGKSGVTVYRDLIASADTSFSYSTSSSTTKFNNSPPAPSPYLNLPLPGLAASGAKFCPYDDVLAIGHSRGISSLLVPGSGEPNFDSAEADVYESHTRRREREVRGVLEKVRPELITLDTDFLGKVGDESANKPDTYEKREARSYRQLARIERLRLDGKLGEGLGGEIKQGEEEMDEDQYDNGQESGQEGIAEGGEREKKKKKMRGKGTATKRYIAKKKANVVDSGLLAMRAKLAEQRKIEERREKKRAGGNGAGEQGGALARFG